MTVLPAGDVLRVDPRKLVYLLTSGKARFFTSHGFSRLRSSELDAALRVHPVRNQIEDIFLTVHGVKFTVRCALPSPDGRDPCALTVWIVDPCRKRFPSRHCVGRWRKEARKNLAQMQSR